MQNEIREPLEKENREPLKKENREPLEKENGEPLEIEIKEPVDFNYRARVYPADKRSKEFDCGILLTDKHLFISRDNPDGTLSVVYMFRFDEIIDIRISRPYATSDDISRGADSKKKEENYDLLLRGGIFGRLFGLRPVGGSGRRGRVKDKYLEIIYSDEMGKPQHLYFNKFDKIPHDLVKRFEKPRKA